MLGSYAKSMFVNAVDELEIVNIVKGSHNKSSYGYDGIDVIIFFKVIDPARARSTDAGPARARPVNLIMRARPGPARDNYAWSRPRRTIFK